MKLTNTQFGEFELPDDAVYEFSHGLLGFEELRRFGIVHLEEYAPFEWLVAVDAPEVCFPILSPQLLAKSYSVPVGNVERSALAAGPEDALVPFVVVTAGSGKNGMSANLRGPIVFNPKSRKGMQVVLFESSYSVRTEIPVISEAQAVP